MIETGTTLQQRYTIDKQIGQGGMGAVYVATDSRFGSTVAIKETLCMDDSFRKAIEREARLLNSLKHSALPRVSDHFEENNGMFLVMEYIPGDDVAAMLEDEKVTFSVDQVMKWADQLLDALDYLHNQEIPVIHRDIKPQNLKINSRGEMILLDFGLAKGNPTDASHQTAAKSIFGYSRSYASLEQIQGTGTDPRSDLYSLAATLYHLLTGVPPEDALTRAMSVLSQKPDPLAPVSAINPDVPRGIAGVLQKAMDLNASERPSSAAEMRQMLRESDNYAYLAEAATFVGTVSDPQVFAQPTRLMPESTRPVFSDPNAKTEVLPSSVSQLTSVRTDGSPSQTNVIASPPAPTSHAKGRGLSAAAGALVMLLVGVVVAGGLYIADPSIFGVTADTGKSTETDKTVPVTADSSVPSNPTTASGNAATSQQNFTDGGSSANSAKVLTETIRPADTEKPVETTKNTTKTTGATKPSTAGEPGFDLDVTVDDPDLPPGGVVVTERDENGKLVKMRVRPPAPPGGQRPPPNMWPLPPDFDMRKLTPAQRQRLQRVLKNNPQMRPSPTPRPKN